MVNGPTASVDQMKSNQGVLAQNGHDQLKNGGNTIVTYEVPYQMKTRTSPAPLSTTTNTYSLPMRKRKSAGPSMFENTTSLTLIEPKRVKNDNESSLDSPVKNVTVAEKEETLVPTTTSDLPPIKRPPMPKAREIRLEQNRKAARESRRRKKVMIEELQRSVIFFSRANATLKQQNDELQRILLQSEAAIRGINNKDGSQNVVPNSGTPPPKPHPVPSSDAATIQQSKPETVSNETRASKNILSGAPVDSSEKQVSTSLSGDAVKTATPDATKITIPDAAAAAALLAAAHSTAPSASPAQQASFMPFFQAMAVNPATIITSPSNPAYAMQQQLAAAQFFAAAANPVVFQQQQAAFQQLQQQAAVAWQNAAANTARTTSSPAGSNDNVAANQTSLSAETGAKQPEKQAL